MKTNIHSPLVAKKQNEELIELANDQRLGDDIRLAVIWELAARNLNSLIPAGLEAEIYTRIDARAAELHEQIKSNHPDDVVVIPKIKWATYLLYTAAALQLLVFFMIDRAFQVDYSSITSQMVGMFVGVALIVFFNVQLISGKKWPRNAFLIWLILGIIVAYRPFEQAQSVYQYYPNLGILQFAELGINMVIRAIALILLFSKEANQFYNGSSEKISGALDQI